jgi:hypothetical protein
VAPGINMNIKGRHKALTIWEILTGALFGNGDIVASVVK